MSAARITQTALLALAALVAVEIPASAQSRYFPNNNITYCNRVQTGWVPETTWQTRTVMRPIGGPFSPRVPVLEYVPVTQWRPQAQPVAVPCVVQSPTPVMTPVVQPAVVATARRPWWRLGWQPQLGWAWMKQPAAATYVPAVNAPPAVTYAASSVPAQMVRPVAWQTPRTIAPPPTYTAQRIASDGGWRASTR